MVGAPLAPKWYNRSMENQVEVLVQEREGLTLAELADLLNSTRSTVEKAVNILRYECIVKVVDGKVYLRDRG